MKSLISITRTFLGTLVQPCLSSHFGSGLRFSSIATCKLLLYKCQWHPTPCDATTCHIVMTVIWLLIRYFKLWPHWRPRSTAAQNENWRLVDRSSRSLPNVTAFLFPAHLSGNSVALILPGVSGLMSETTYTKNLLFLRSHFRPHYSHDPSSYNQMSLWIYVALFFFRCMWGAPNTTWTWIMTHYQLLQL